MPSATTKSKNIKTLFLWILIWAISSAYYALSIKYDFHTIEADYFAYAIQMLADIFMANYAIKAYINTSDEISKLFLLGVLISIIPGLISTESYNLLVNIIRITTTNTVITAFWTLPYTFFLAIQILSWSYLLFIKRIRGNLTGVNKSSNYLYIQSGLIILLFTLLAVGLKEVIIKDMGLIQEANTILEVILFTIMSTCLLKTKETPLIYVESGFLLLIAFNLVHRFSYLTGHNYKSFDLAWLISYIIIIYGFFKISNENRFKIEFFRPNSIHSTVSATFNIFATVLFILFLALWFLILMIQENYNYIPHMFPEHISGIIVALLTFSILFGKLIGKNLSKPIENVFSIVTYIDKPAAEQIKLAETNFSIYEVEELKTFILKTIKELRIANRVKSEFLMNMSHDFRTPASGIYHMSKSLHKKIDDPELKKLQKLIINSSEQLMSFFDDILDYSRLDGNQYDISSKNFDINETINEIILFTSAKTNEKQLKIEVKPSSETLIYYGDRLMIHRIVLNIVSNAIKFTQNGHIEIFTGKQKMGQNEYVAIQVKDSGIGISRKNHKLIFEPFTRIEPAEKSKYPGIGLGLSNVKLMLDKIGGLITVESELGFGSTFTIFLPISTQDHE